MEIQESMFGLKTSKPIMNIFRDAKKLQLYNKQVDKLLKLSLTFSKEDKYMLEARNEDTKRKRYDSITKVASNQSYI